MLLAKERILRPNLNKCLSNETAKDVCMFNKELLRVVQCTMQGNCLIRSWSVEGNWHIANNPATMTGCCENLVAPLSSLLPSVFKGSHVDAENQEGVFFLCNLVPLYTC